MKRIAAVENYILWIIIAAYLLFVLFKSKKEKSLEKKKIVVSANANVYEAAIITAAITAAMGSEKDFAVKKILLVGYPDNYNSSWKLAGRTETMMRKLLSMHK